MPIYKVKAPDGKVYKVMGPENADPELLFATVAEKNQFASLTNEQLNAIPSAGTSIGDVGRSLGTGLIGGVKSIADVFGAGSDISSSLGETMQGLQAGITPERQAEMARRAEKIERADRSGSKFEQAKAYLGSVAEAPLQTTVQALGTSVPTIVAGLATLPVSAPASIAAGVGIIARLAVGAAQGVGEFKGSAYDAVKGHYLKEGKSQEEATRLAEEAQQYSADKAVQIGGAALLGSLDSVLGSENVVMKAMRRASPTGKMTKEAVDAGIKALPEKALTKPTFTGALGRSMIGEAPLEGAQGAFGQYAQNVAMQQAGIDTPTDQGVFGSGLRDAAVGALAGGAFSPLQKSTMNTAYSIDQFLRQAKGEQEISAEADAALKRKQATDTRVKTGLGVPSGEMLALPAPAAKAEREIEPALIDLQNPVGTISRNELPADTLSYIDKYRTENNLPRLTSFSLEDVKDAMTSQNPEGERAALDSIIAAKTGYTGKEKYTAEDILNAAVEKNIAPDTKGFSDFLQRATGERDVNTMSQPQLFSAFNALKATKASATGEQIVLPEGSNATRFTTDQYNEGLTLLGKYLEQSEGKPLSMEQATDVVAAQTDLGDYAADILRVAANNDDVIVENGTVFQTVDKETGEITGTYGVKEDAASAAGKAATVQETRGPVVRSRIEEKQVKRAALPGGYELEEETLKEGEKPAEYQIMVEGKAKPLATVLEENDVAGKVERLQGLRQKEAAKVLADIQKNETTVNKGRAALESMEARGASETEGYKKAQAQQARAEDILGRRIKRMLVQIEDLSAPLKAKPAGKKQVTRQAFKLTKAGKEVGKFPSRAAAEESVLTELTDAELETLTTQEGPTAARAAKALEARKEQKAGKTGIKVKGTTEGLEEAGVYTQEVQAKIDALEKLLTPMLAKFGLQDVGLNIVRKLQAGAEGSYLDKLIQVTLTADKPITTLRHEVLHALKELGFFTPPQWDVLTKKANEEWIGKYLKSVNAEIDGKVMSRYDAYKAMGLTDEDIMEEAIADAFAAYELGTDKPTPGMIAALFKRLQNFFAAFAQALGRAKIESAEEIFGKIERGELAKAGLEQTAKEKLSLAKQPILRNDRNSGKFGPNEKTISTRKPTSVDPVENLYTDKLNVGIGVVKEDPKLLAKHADLVRNDPLMGEFKSDSDEETINYFIEMLKGNLLALWKATPKDIRNRSKNWYKGANKIANNLAQAAGISEHASSGVLAALSPQTPWDVNVSQAARVITIWKNHQNTVADSAMTDWFDSKIKALEKKGDPKVMTEIRDAIAGKSFKDVEGTGLQPWWLRAYDETHHSREFHLVAPEGKSAGLMTKKDGEPASMPWGNTGNIEKALAILRDDSMENISDQMGDAHKVRSFYNNIVYPDSLDEHVTIDTHAVAAARFEPLSGNAPAVKQAWGGEGSSTIHGQNGLYGEYAEAYRRAANELEVLPREVQSVTWEKVRGLFPDTFKTEKAVNNVKSIWKQYQDGAITIDEARDQITKSSPNKDPNWSGVPTESAKDAGASLNDVEPPSSDVRGDGTADGAKLSLKTAFSTPEAAEKAAYKKAPPQTSEFKLFFGASTLMEEGRPQVMYHASPNEFDAFSERKPIFVSPEAKEAQFFSAIKRLGRKSTRDYIYPLWVRAETPFDYENAVHVQQVIDKMDQDKTRGGIQPQFFADGKWDRIEDRDVQAAIKALGFDSFYVKEGEAKNLAVYSAAQVKSVTGNIGEFDREAKDIRFSLRKAPTTPEFKRFFSGSKVVNEDGSPKVMYHGTNKDFNEFVIAEKANRTAMPDGFYFTSNENDASRYAKGEGASVMPVYLSIKNPFNLGKKNKISKEMVMQFRDELRADNPTLPFDWIQEKVNIFKENTAAGRFPFPSISFPTAAMQRVFEVGGYDGLIDGSKVFVAFDPKQVKSATGNIGTYDPTNPDIRYSLPTVSKAATDRVNATTTTREVKGFPERMTEAISPQSRSFFRAKAINRYNQLGVYDRKRAETMGGAAFLADVSAESAALMSDLGAGVTASALGFGDRNGGIPVYRNGITTVDRSVKGLVASLAPLAKYGDPKVYQYYQYWAAVKRGTRLLEAGRERLINEGDKALAAELQKKFPEFIDVQKDYTAFNNGVVKYMVDTGVLSKERGDEYMKYADYVPFYRQADGETTIGPNIFQAIAGVKPPKKLKGSDAPLADFLETIVRNTQASIQAGMKNSAAQRAVNVASQVTSPGMGVERLNTKQSGPDIINVLENGDQVSYRTVDSLLVDAIGSLHMPDIPFLGILSGPSDLLRNLVTKDPGFMMANLLRDSLSAWVTSGQKMTPIAGTVINFGKALAGKSPGMEAMMDAGIIGGYEFSANVESSGAKLATDLARKSGKEGLAAPLRAVRWLWEGLEKGTTASDAATRALVYERVMAETGNEAEALFRSLEVMNFNRKGSSAIIRVLTAAVPFFNARLQGLDVFYRASTGRMNMDNAAEIQKNFFVRGAMMAGLTAIYWFLTHEDDEYKKQEQETRDNNWLFPSAGIKIPIPFEVGVLFKQIPERILEYTFGDDTGKDFAKSMGTALFTTFAFNPIPQTVKPLVEVATNYNFFTMRPVIGQGMEDVASKYQVGPSTSKLFEEFGKLSGLSPMKVEQLYKGYTGTMGMYLVDVVDSILNANSNSPNATKRFEQLPVVKRFALDKEARGNITQYYELKNSVDTTVRTMNLLEKTARPEDFSNYVQQNIGYLANKDYVRDLEKSMKELREMRTAIRSSGMTGDTKRDTLKLVGEMENNLTANIQTVKKTIASLQ